MNTISKKVWKKETPKGENVKSEELVIERIYCDNWVQMLNVFDIFELPKENFPKAYSSGYIEIFSKKGKYNFYPTLMETDAANFKPFHQWYTEVPKEAVEVDREIQESITKIPIDDSKFMSRVAWNLKRHSDLKEHITERLNNNLQVPEEIWSEYNQIFEEYLNTNRL